ncbi:hypothetical protein [Moorena sp. SIO4G3]|nr:hypothetical protein [Moorena sp. SIO4G3]NEO80179.1 hypothetical protein [Moorena sp. SIO4G3]
MQGKNFITVNGNRFHYMWLRFKDDNMVLMLAVAGIELSILAENQAIYEA